MFEPVIEYTKEELERLYELAEKVNWKRRNEFQWLFREKDWSYFRTILQGDRFMRIYKKDRDGQSCRPGAFNGDPRSPLNCDYARRPQGLFFCANRSNFGGVDSLPDPLFGNTRFILDVSDLIQPNFNMYFADFYCREALDDNDTHYATIVVTDPQSTTPNVEGFKNMDAWCEQKLLPMNRHNNRLLYCDQTNNKWFVSSSIWVEVFFTEDIKIEKDELERFDISENNMRFPKKKTRGCWECNIGFAGP